jgi:hypothetical protein
MLGSVVKGVGYPVTVFGCCKPKPAGLTRSVRCSGPEEVTGGR